MSRKFVSPYFKNNQELKHEKRKIMLRDKESSRSEKKFFHKEKEFKKKVDKLLKDKEKRDIEIKREEQI